MTAHTGWWWLRFWSPRESLAAKATTCQHWLSRLAEGENTNIVGQKVGDQWGIQGSQEREAWTIAHTSAFPDSSSILILGRCEGWSTIGGNLRKSGEKVDTVDDGIGNVDHDG